MAEQTSRHHEILYKAILWRGHCFIRRKTKRAVAVRFHGPSVLMWFTDLVDYRSEYGLLEVRRRI